MLSTFLEWSPFGLVSALNKSVRTFIERSFRTENALKGGSILSFFFFKRCSGFNRTGLRPYE